MFKNQSTIKKPLINKFKQSNIISKFSTNESRISQCMAYKHF